MLYTRSTTKQQADAPVYKIDGIYYDGERLEEIDAGDYFDDWQAAVSISMLSKMTSQPLVLECTKNGTVIIPLILISKDKTVTCYYNNSQYAIEDLVIVGAYPIVLPNSRLPAFDREIAEILVDAWVINIEVRKLNSQFPFGKLSLGLIGLPVKYQKL